MLPLYKFLLFFFMIYRLLFFFMNSKGSCKPNKCMHTFRIKLAHSSLHSQIEGTYLQGDVGHFMEKLVIAISKTHVKDGDHFLGVAHELEV